MNALRTLFSILCALMLVSCASSSVAPQQPSFTAANPAVVRFLQDIAPTAVITHGYTISDITKEWKVTTDRTIANMLDQDDQGIIPTTQTMLSPASLYQHINGNKEVLIEQLGADPTHLTSLLAELSELDTLYQSTLSHCQQTEAFAYDTSLDQLQRDYPITLTPLVIEGEAGPDQQIQEAMEYSQRDDVKPVIFYPETIAPSFEDSAYKFPLDGYRFENYILPTERSMTDTLAKNLAVISQALNCS